MSEIRFCKLFNKEVIFAPNRLKRKIFTPTQRKQNSEICAFDKGYEDQTPHEVERIQTDGQWQCRVVPNLYNVLGLEKDDQSYKDGFNEKKEGFGAHEVVIETPHHTKNFFNFKAQEFNDYFTILQKRVISLQKDTRLKAITIFKNHGFKAGASQEHSHSQILALSKPLNKDRDFIERQTKYYKLHQRTLLNDIIYEELQDSKRVVHDCQDFFIYAPYASEFGYELMVVSKTAQKITQLSKEQITTLAALFEQLFSKYQEVLGEFDFNLLFNLQLDDAQEYTNFYIQITPRFNMIAGVELGSGTFINPFMPEVVAQKMKF